MFYIGAAFLCLVYFLMALIGLLTRSCWQPANMVISAPEVGRTVRMYIAVYSFSYVCRLWRCPAVVSYRYSLL